eukprot:EG_transcript_42208
MFMWVAVVYIVGAMHYMVDFWTVQSYSALVPGAASAVVVQGAGAPQDISAELRDHLATLAAYRAVQVAIANSLGLWVYNMLRGLNWWSLVTSVWVFLVMVVGTQLNPAA